MRNSFIRLNLSLALIFTVIPVRMTSQSSSELNLSGKWKVTWNDGNHGSNDIDHYNRYYPLKDTARYMDVDVPLDLNLAMQKKGLLGDFNYGMNYMTARWVSEQYWQYYKVFNLPKEALNKSTWLIFERLDYAARISLNGELIGKHSNTHIPCIINVTGKIKEGKNIVYIGIESGMYEVADKSAADYNYSIDMILNKRHWLRKPQYQFSWDWNPKLINVGITGDVKLIWREDARIDHIVPWIKMADDLSSADLTIRTFIEGTKENNLTIEATIIETNQKVSSAITTSKDIMPYELKMKVDKPKLWWPVGHGSPVLYTIRIDVKLNGKIVDSGTRKVGFRKMEIDRSKHPVEGNYFTVRINNRPIFMKGGNWVPADMIYSSVDKKRLEKLVDLAVDANFNILRIWGGGLFAGNDLLGLCDEKGLVVWHDFLFACSEYPGDNVEFYKKVKQEVTWAVREFAYHPSLIVWCGSNELEWGAWSWGYVDKGKVVPDYIIYHHLMPVIMKEEDPYRFFWTSSPYSENFEEPNSPVTGDQHPWKVSLGEDGTNMWAYRKYIDRFPNEGGVLGASSPATMRQFLPRNEQYVRSFSWDGHDNEVNFWPDSNGVTYKFTEDWIGKNYHQLSFDDYLFASSLLQAEGLTEYITNYHRRMYSSSSAIFWMYNDSWPATHGWTIVDYYLRKKLAYHPVCRAFRPINVVVADEDSVISIYGINESPEEWKGTLQYGIFETHGKTPLDKKQDVVLSPLKSVLLASIDRDMLMKAGINKNGSFAVLRANEEVIAQHRLFISKFKDIEFDKPAISIKYNGNNAVLTSTVFVWGVCLDINGESKVADNCFDLLPGIPYYIKLNKGEKINVLRTGNDLFK